VRDRLAGFAGAERLAERFGGRLWVGSAMRTDLSAVG
jgi:hypothetical protein